MLQHMKLILTSVVETRNAALYMALIAPTCRPSAITELLWPLRSSALYCRTLHPPVSAYYAQHKGGHPPYQYPCVPNPESSPQATSKTVIQTLLVLYTYRGASAARCNCGWMVLVRCNGCGWTVMMFYCCCTADSCILGFKTVNYSLVLSA